MLFWLLGQKGTLLALRVPGAISGRLCNPLFASVQTWWAGKSVSHAGPTLVTRDCFLRVSVVFVGPPKFCAAPISAVIKSFTMSMCLPWHCAKWALHKEQAGKWVMLLSEPPLAHLWNRLRHSLPLKGCGCRAKGRGAQAARAKCLAHLGPIP